jgi:hypothetical protein
MTSRDGDVVDLVGVGTRTVGGWWTKLERSLAPEVNLVKVKAKEALPPEV